MTGISPPATQESNQHVHTCMSCGQSWNCPIPEHCLAQESVLPSIVLPGPHGPQIFDHVCQRKK